LKREDESRLELYVAEKRPRARMRRVFVSAFSP